MRRIRYRPEEIKEIGFKSVTIGSRKYVALCWWDTRKKNKIAVRKGDEQFAIDYPIKAYTPLTNVEYEFE